MNDILMHYGMLERSGRYPWGSGENPYQRLGSKGAFLYQAQQLEEEGLSEKEIASYFGMSIREYRSESSNAKNALRAANQAEAVRLKEKGYSNTAIAEKMGVNESTVRSWLDTDRQVRTSRASNTAEALKTAVAEKTYIDIGGGVENVMGVSRTVLDNAVQLLKEEGYHTETIWVNQVGTNGQRTKMKVLVGPDTTYSDILKNQSSIDYPDSPGFYSTDGGTTIDIIQEPVSIVSDRIQVVYGDEGGSDKDGVIELRRGVDDISLGDSSYAQVRIAVDGTHYLKGMAVYADDLPDGVDIRFNTNKQSGTPLKGDKDNSVLKSMKDDSDNPFGATVRQKTYVDADGNAQLSAINIVNEQGDWATWNKTLSAQFLSKQSTTLISSQLNATYDVKQAEYDEIMGLENNVVKSYLLEKFADECDASASDLKAIGLPRQSSKVLIPLTDISSDEIYAPTYNNGEKVALVRYPHAGIFEIPVLTVNNKSSQQGKDILGNTSQDAVGISSETAQQLSGADFDGDTVLVIPLSTAKIQSSSPLEGLKDFNPQVSYAAYEGMTPVSESGFQKQKEMGMVSNLITDMTIKGATESEIARAVRHSMVVIDAEKHNLNYKQSYIDNGIAALKEKYQDGGGASTLISKAGATVYIEGVRTTGTYTDPDTGEKTYGVNPNTGEKVYKTTQESFTTKDGKTVNRVTKSTNMAETNDAYTLSSGTVKESLYAEYANKLKALANSARKEAVAAKKEGIEYSSEARKTYSDEVDSLTAKLNEALKNRPAERKAQLLANAKIKEVKAANPDISSDKDAYKKLQQRALKEARTIAGTTSRKNRGVDITEKEWEAIQSGAISTNKLNQIVANTDIDVLRQYSMPKSWNGLSPSKESRIKAMAANGYTLAEIADALDISTSTVSRVING